MNYAAGSAAEGVQAFTSLGPVWEDEVLHREAFEAAYPDVKITCVRDGRTWTGRTWTAVVPRYPSASPSTPPPGSRVLRWEPADPETLARVHAALARLPPSP
jgi:hypothetical protein